MQEQKEQLKYDIRFCIKDFSMKASWYGLDAKEFLELLRVVKEDTEREIEHQTKVLEWFPYVWS